MALSQKFDVVSESHRFSYDFFVFSRDMAQNACRYIYVLGSKGKAVGFNIGSSNWSAFLTFLLISRDGPL